MNINIDKEDIYGFHCCMPQADKFLLLYAIRVSYCFCGSGWELLVAKASCNKYKIIKHLSWFFV
jgi:hypothetical protein